MIDSVDWIALALAAIPCLAWFGILRAHYLTLRIGTQRVQTLTTRIALFLPTYALLLWFSFVIPNLFAIMEAPIAIAEGLSFYGFFAMMISNLGGPNHTIRLMTESGRTPCCCCPKDPLKFFNRVKTALFQFLVCRPIVMILAAFSAYQDQQALTLIFTAIGLVMLAYGFISLVLFYENLMHVSGNVNGACKILILKFSVGMIVVQNLIEQILYTTGTMDIHSNDRYSAEQRAERALCIAVLIEYSIFSLLVYWIFASDIDIHETTAMAHSGSHINPEDRPEITWSQWVRDVLNIMDLFHDLTPSEAGGDLTMKLNDEKRPPRSYQSSAAGGV